MIRRKSWWCALRSSAICFVLAESPRRARSVRQGLHHLGLKHAHPQRERGDLDVIQPPLEPYEACPRELDTRLIPDTMLALALTTPSGHKIAPPIYSYLWPSASMTSSGVRGACFGVHSGRISAFFSDTLPAAATSASKTITMTVIISATGTNSRRFFVIVFTNPGQCAGTA